MCYRHTCVNSVQQDMLVTGRAVAILGQERACAFQLPVGWGLVFYLLTPVGSLVGDGPLLSATPPCAFLWA